MYENSVVALHKILESPTTAGDRPIHSCKISTIPPQVTYLENGLKYYCIEVTCDDGREFAIQEYGDEAETLFREAHKCILCPHTSYLPELESLGIKPNHINELNDNYEMENLVIISNSHFSRTTNLQTYMAYHFKHSSIFRYFLPGNIYLNFSWSSLRRNNCISFSSSR